MVIRKTPTDENVIGIDDMQIARELQKNGFMPKFIDENYLYFVRSDEIEKFLEKIKEI